MTSGELLPLRHPVPRPAEEPRQSDVDEWGRSERARAFIRQIYGPLYRHWFRAEWEGLERIPAAGGALLVANHAGAIPADAPAIMHGIEEEVHRPVYGLADYLFRSLPVLGTAWSYLKLRELGVRRPASLDWWGNVTFAAGLIAIAACLVAAVASLLRGRRYVHEEHGPPARQGTRPQELVRP